MISFNSGISTENVLALFRTIFEGMSQPNFDDGTGIARRAGIRNIVVERNSQIFLEMSFDCIYGHVSITHSKLSSMRVDLLAAPIQENYDEEEREAFSYTVSPAKNNDDYSAITKIITMLGNEHPDNFRLNNQLGDRDSHTVIHVSFEQFVAFHKDLADLLINIIGKQLGFIRPNEARFLNDIFALGNEPIHREKVTQLLLSQFDQFFDTLKEHDHILGNEFVFNDLDNYLHYVVNQDESVKGIVLRSQNHMFLFAKDMDTGIIKIWNTMQLYDNPEQAIFYKLAGDYFDGVQYMFDMLHSRYGQPYEYPFEFSSNYYRKLPKTLIENFDSFDYNGQLIYSSDAGFYPNHSRKFDSCISEIDWAYEVVCSEYEVEPMIINNSSIDYRSPTYVIRSLTNGLAFNNRVAALSYLFTTMGHDFYWENGGITNGSNVIEELDQNDHENKIEPITSEVFNFGNACMIFHRPDNVSSEWLTVIREFVGYYKTWVDNHPEPTSSMAIEAQNRLKLLITI